MLCLLICYKGELTFDELPPPYSNGKHQMRESVALRDGPVYTMPENEDSKVVYTKAQDGPQGSYTDKEEILTQEANAGGEENPAYYAEGESSGERTHSTFIDET